MDTQKLNWQEIKASDYMAWRDELDTQTLRWLTRENFLDPARYNQEGFFHKVKEPEYFEQMKQDFLRKKKVPPEWISKGYFPGIWLAMFYPHNTYSYHFGPLCLTRFYFKDGYRIYDGQNPKHKDLWTGWEHRNEPNPWRDAVNEKGISVEERMKGGFYFPFPEHKRFFEEYRFGAAIGYSDYTSPVVFLEDAIEHVEFLDSE